MADAVVGAIVGVFFFLVVVREIYISIHFLKEKEVKIIERLGRYHRTLTPGIHFVMPFIDRPKKYTHRYYVSNNLGHTKLVEKKNYEQISTWNEVLDFPKQQVITRDNAKIHLDAILQYRISNPKRMIYNTQNLPMMLSKNLQAQIRNIAGLMDVDQVIEETAALNRISIELDRVATRWGVKVEFVRVQRVEAGRLSNTLAKAKNADLSNRQVIINAKMKKQTQIIESEGNRDRLIKEAEGEAMRTISNARGQAQAIKNRAIADAKSVSEIARAVSRFGENPTKYLLAMRYIKALHEIVMLPNTKVEYMPKETSFVQVATSQFGMNALLPSSR